MRTKGGTCTYVTVHCKKQQKNNHLQNVTLNVLANETMLLLLLLLFYFFLNGG